MSADRRNPHQPFDRSLVQEFSQGWELLSAELLHTGRSNTNYTLMLNDGLRCVLRIYSNGGAQRESYVMSLVSDLVPVPEELHRGDNWSIFSFIKGDLLESVPKHIAVDAEVLARMSSVEFPAPAGSNPTTHCLPSHLAVCEGSSQRLWIKQKCASGWVRMP